MLETIEALIRAGLYTLLALVAAMRLWRPMTAGMTREDCDALLSRARPWLAIGALGVVAHVTSALDVPTWARDVVSTALVALVVVRGIDALRVRKT